ncbi:hypothetical protein JVU11DRAFT_6058 [Chiua virens]|nr:hypothetical protein JVU11DRAFT_6058 [Chiua virens]
MINIYSGPVVNPQTLTHYLALPRCLIAVGSDGNIIWIEDEVDDTALQTMVANHGLKDGDYTLVRLNTNSGEFLMPGLIDTHIHASQFPNLGVGGNLELPEWLAKYTMPLEESFRTLDTPEKVYSDAVERIIACGTTTACYYTTPHLPSTIRLADIVRDRGQRAFVGIRNIDHNYPIPGEADLSPQDLDSGSESLRKTIEFIEHIQRFPPSLANEPLVHAILSPDSVLACSEDLLRSLSKFVASFPHLSIQSHVLENEQDIDAALKRFQTDSYVEILDRFGLLRSNTILGHCVWLNEKDISLIAQRGAGVSHCPTSNFNLTSGIARVSSLLDHGIKVSLATDVSGGYSPSILNVIQMASAASKVLYLQANPEDKSTQQKLPDATLLYLATKGGAEVCSLSDRIGSFEVGKAFDALHVNICHETGNPAIWGHDLDEDESAEENLRRWLERFLFCGDNRNVSTVYVQGAGYWRTRHGASIWRTSMSASERFGRESLRVQ